MSWLNSVGHFITDELLGVDDIKSAWHHAEKGEWGAAAKSMGTAALELGTTVAIPFTGGASLAAKGALTAGKLATAGRAVEGIAGIGKVAEAAKATQTGIQATRAVTAPARASWLTDVAGATTRGSNATSTITRAADHTMYELPDAAAVAGPRAASMSSRAMADAAEIPFKASEQAGSVLTKTKPKIKYQTTIPREVPGPRAPSPSTWDPYTSKPPFEVTPTPKTDAIPKLFEADPKVKTLPDYNPAHPMGEPVIPRPSAPATVKPSEPLTTAPVPAMSPSVAPTVAETVAADAATQTERATITGTARNTAFATGTAAGVATATAAERLANPNHTKAPPTTSTRGRRPHTSSFVYVPGQDVHPQANF
jgi:hypothetical protein